MVVGGLYLSSMINTPSGPLVLALPDDFAFPTRSSVSELALIPAPAAPPEVFLRISKISEGWRVSFPKIPEKTSKLQFSSLHVITIVDTMVTMVLELKLRKIGNSVGVVLPKEALARLNASEGDSIFFTESPDGAFRVTAQAPDFAQKMKVFDNLSRRYRNALRELAK